METKIKLPFNPELPSSLSKERINELNQLALKATIDDRRPVNCEVDNHCLVMDTCAMEALFEVLLDVSDDTMDFYYHIDSAFKRLMIERPKEFDAIFRNYTKLTKIFRLVEKHQKYIDIKLNDAMSILSDLDQLENESFEFGKGGVKC